MAFWVEQKESNQNTFSTTSELKYLLKKMTENNIGLTIGRNYRKSNISTFKPRSLVEYLEKNRQGQDFFLYMTNVQKNL